MILLLLSIFQCPHLSRYYQILSIIYYIYIILGKTPNWIAIVDDFTVAIDIIHVIDTRPLFNVAAHGVRSIPEQGTNHGAETCARTDDIDGANGVAIAGVDNTCNGVSPYGGVNIINDDRVGEYSTTFNNDKLMENPDNLLSLSPIDLINLGYYYEMTELIYNVFTYYTFTFSDDSYTDIFIRYSDNWRIRPY